MHATQYRVIVIDWDGMHRVVARPTTLAGALVAVARIFENDGRQAYHVAHKGV